MPIWLWLILGLLAVGIAYLVYVLTVAGKHDIRSDWDNETAEARKRLKHL